MAIEGFILIYKENEAVYISQQALNVSFILHSMYLSTGAFECTSTVQTPSDSSSRFEFQFINMIKKKKKTKTKTTFMHEILI